MGQPAARIGDPHLCPMVTGIVPHVGGPVVLGEFTVLTGKMPQSRIGDLLTCVGPPDAFAMGSSGVIVGKKPASRVGDLTVHAGSVIVGCFTVLIGETGSGSVGGNSPVTVDVLSGAAGMSKPSQQAATLYAAHQEGSAFCERCQ